MKIKQFKFMDTPVALVTGSGKRLGRKIALALAETGYDIIVNYHQSVADARKTEKLIRQMGRKTVLIKADVRRPDHIKKMFNEVIKKFGKIDVLINNAAIFPKKTELPNIPESIWDDVIDSNPSAGTEPHSRENQVRPRRSHDLSGIVERRCDAGRSHLEDWRSRDQKE